MKLFIVPEELKNLILLLITYFVSIDQKINDDFYASENKCINHVKQFQKDCINNI